MSYRCYAWTQAIFAAARERKKQEVRFTRDHIIFDFIDCYRIMRTGESDYEPTEYQTIEEAEEAIRLRTINREEMLRHLAEIKREHLFMRNLKNVLFGGDHLSDSTADQCWGILTASEDSFRLAFLKTIEQ